MRAWIVTTAEPDARIIGVYASEKHAEKHAAAAPLDTGEPVYVLGPFEIEGAEVVENPAGGSYYRALPDWLARSCPTHPSPSG